MARTAVHSPAPATRAATAAAPAPRVAAPAARPARLPSGPPAHRLGTHTATPGGGTAAQSLPPAVQTVLERSFQVNLDAVRVRTDASAQRAARGLSARAFTYGNQIFLGAGERPTDLRLMAHETAHVVQQQGAPRIQRWASHQADPYEREADRAAAAVLRFEPFAVREKTGGFQVQRLGLSDALNFFADQANLIPGFRMFTIILGVNPINMSRVERSAANILRAVIEFLPGGNLITQALDNYGILEKVGAWVEEQIATLGLAWQSIKQALSAFLDSLSWKDIFHLGDLWDRAKRIFTEPIGRVINFVKGLVAGIVKFIKEALLRPLAKLAEKTPAYDLLKAVLGEDPVTGDPVPRNAETLIGGFMKLIGQEEIWQNIKKARAIERAWAWFQGALSGLLALVRRIPSLFVAAFKALELTDIILVPRAFAKLASVFAGFFGDFFKWAGNTIWNLLEIIFDALAPAVMPYLRKAAAAFRTILKNPIGFVGNLVRAAKQGFQQFAGRIGTHLKNSLIQWLTGTLSGAGVYIPQSFTIREIIKFVLSVLGLTWQNVRQKLVKVVGETAVKVMETTFDIVVTLVTQGPAAAWEKIKEQLTNLQEIVLEGVMSFVTTKIVQSAVTKLLSMLNPAGAFVQAIIAIYNTVMFFIERLKTIMQVAMAFIDSIAAIAGGVIGAAANKVEQTLAGLLTLAISFLARLVGLGKVSDAVKDIINKIRAPIDKALDKVVDWIVQMAKKFLAKLTGKVDTKESKDVKTAAAGELRGKAVGSRQEEDSLLHSVYAKFAPKGLKGLKFVRQKDKLAVFASASLPDEVAKLDLKKPVEQQELIRIMKSMFYLSKSTTIYTYYAGRRIDRVENYPGHAEWRFVEQSLGKLINVLKKEINAGQLKPDASVTVRLDITRSPCKGCAETHVPEALARLKAEPELKKLNILLSINAAAVTVGRAGEAGLELLLKPENAGKVEIKASDLWKAIFDQVRAYPQFFVEVITEKHFSPQEIRQFQSQASNLDKAIKVIVDRYNAAPKDEKEGDI
jgi:hypothetical protein